MNSNAEPRAATTVDLLVATVGMSCAFALPSGLSWFSLPAAANLRSVELVTDFLLWGCCVVAVGAAFAVVARHYRYMRGARPAECLVIALATVYLSLAFTQLHAEYSSLSMLVTKMEAGLQTDLGPWLRVAIALILFTVVAAYIGILMWQGQLSPPVKTLLGTALVLFWYWGPCDVWAAQWHALAVDWPWTWGLLLVTALVPRLPFVFLPLVLFCWSIFSRRLTEPWWLMEYTGVVLFGVLAILLYFHPAVRQHRGEPTFFVELIVFVLLNGGLAMGVGWGLARLDKALRYQPRTGARGTSVP